MADTHLPPELLKQAILASNEGITIADMRQPGQPLVFVNDAFEKISGYHADEVLGRNCNFLQGSATQTEQVQKIRMAIANKQSCDVTLRNYRKSGEAFWNRLSLSPVFNDSGDVSHYIGVQRDVTREVLLTGNLKRLNKLYHDINDQLIGETDSDVLTGLSTQHYLDTAGKLLLANAQRENWTLNVYLIEIQKLNALMDHYGQANGDICLQQVASSVSDTFSRNSDICARLDNDTFLVITINHGDHEPQKRAQELQDSIHAHSIQLDHDRIHIDANIGAISLQPKASDTIDSVLKRLTTTIANQH